MSYYIYIIFQVGKFVSERGGFNFFLVTVWRQSCDKSTVKLSTTVAFCDMSTVNISTVYLSTVYFSTPPPKWIGRHVDCLGAAVAMQVPAIQRNYNPLVAVCVMNNSTRTSLYYISITILFIAVCDAH